MSTTDPAEGEADTPRVAEARRRAAQRGHRQSARMHLALWVVMALTAGFAVPGRPRLAFTGEGLGISLALAGCLVPLSLAALDREPRSQVGTAVLPLILGVSGNALAVLRPTLLMEIPVAAAVAMLFARLRPRTALFLAAPLVMAIAVITTASAPSGISLQAGLSSVLLCVVLGASYVFSRQARLGRDRTELLLAELEDSREAEARAAAVAERARIARELHDVLAQSLSALSVQLEGARKLAERDHVDPALHRLIVRGGELTREGLSEARRAVAALRGDDVPTLDQLTALVDRCRRDLGLPIALSVTGEPRQLTAEANLALYRGAQEALTNAARYAPGSPTDVLLRYTAEGTTLTVTDHGRPAFRRADEDAAPGSADGDVANGDGTGSGPRSTSGPGEGGEAAVRVWTGGGNGLRGMRERIERVGGRTHAGPMGRGWSVRMEIPG
ncbi:histidine kinase [Streptomyces sp. ICBB 8177]|uniref:sensor histidine kinase n=1 Tax=Streptomyces sp. ICBB 8177 TaxID=563922 RepID=UPI00130516A8|nr:histidine kinase [Streptomyces sp. ICBB 8177]